LRPSFLDRLKAAGVDLDPGLFERQILSTDQKA